MRSLSPARGYRLNMSDTVGWIQAGTGIASAIASAFAAYIACKALSAATAAQGAAEASERRVARREIAADAVRARAESERVERLVDLVIGAHRGAAVSTQTLGGSRLQLATDAAEQKRLIARTLAERSALFDGEAQSLRHSTIEDLDRVALQQRENLNRASALREELERELEILQRERMGRDHRAGDNP